MSKEKMDVRESPYAEWLESFIKQVMKYQPDRIGVCAIIPDGNVLTGFYGECTPQDKALMAYHIHIDAVFDTIKVNAKEILQAAEEAEEQEEDDDT